MDDQITEGIGDEKLGESGHFPWRAQNWAQKAHDLKSNSHLQMVSISLIIFETRNQKWQIKS